MLSLHLMILLMHINDLSIRIIWKLPLGSYGVPLQLDDNLIICIKMNRNIPELNIIKLLVQERCDRLKIKDI